MRKEDCIKEMNNALPNLGIDFDSVVVVMLDRKTSMMDNWWYFSGHPDSWGSKELSDIAQQMTATTAELLKSDRNVNQRKVLIKTKNHVFGPSIMAHSILLFAFGIIMSKHDAMDRLWFWFELNKWEFGFSASIVQCYQIGTADPYWSFKMIIGPLCVRLTRKKKSA